MIETTFNPKKIRESGIELLRILTMLAVLVIHYFDGRAFKYVNDGNHNVGLLLISMSICAVDLFILISGYFLCTRQKRTLIKPAKLLLQVILYSVIIYLVLVLLGENTFSYKVLLYNFLPNNYFIILYVALYLISPYINRVLQKLSKKALNIFMITLMMIFSLWTTGTDLFEEVFNHGETIMGLSTVGAFGAERGFTIVNFVLMYCVGAFLRFNKEKIDKISTKKLLVIQPVLILLVFAWSMVCEKFTMTEMRSSWVYHNPLVIMIAVIAFILFSRIKFSSKIINELAGASFTCFLIHHPFLDHSNFQYYATQNVFVMMLHILVVIVSIYLISWIVYKLFNLLTNWLFTWLENFKLFSNYDVTNL